MKRKAKRGEGSTVRWGTNKENSLDRRLDGTASKVKGTDNPNAALNEVQVLSIAADTKFSNAELGRHYGVSTNAIRKIRTGQTWSWLTNKKARRDKR